MIKEVLPVDGVHCIVISHISMFYMHRVIILFVILDDLKPEYKQVIDRVNNCYVLFCYFDYIRVQCW